MEQHSVVRHLPSGMGGEPKPVELQLAWYVNDYKVVSITNSTVLKPGMWLDPAVVQILCRGDAFANWTIKMADNEIIEALFSVGAGVISGATKL